MSGDEGGRDTVDRRARLARLIDHLERLDDDTLVEIDRLATQALRGAQVHPEAATRREFLRAAAAGGLLVAATGGLAAWRLGFARLDAAEQEAASLRQIVALYRELDEADLDARVVAGLQALDESASALRSDAERVSAGLTVGRDAIDAFRAQFPTLQGAFQWLRQTVVALSQRLLALENSANRLLGVTAPLRETAGRFFAWLLDRLPASAAGEAREPLERSGEVVTAASGLVEGIHSRILDPLDNWFSVQPDAGLNGALLNPLIAGALDPAGRFAVDAASLVGAWEAGWIDGVRQALDRRREIRARIAYLNHE